MNDFVYIYDDYKYTVNEKSFFISSIHIAIILCVIICRYVDAISHSNESFQSLNIV